MTPTFETLRAVDEMPMRAAIKASMSSWLFETLCEGRDGLPMMERAKERKQGWKG